MPFSAGLDLSYRPAFQKRAGEHAVSVQENEANRCETELLSSLIGDICSASFATNGMGWSMKRCVGACCCWGLTSVAPFLLQRSLTLKKPKLKSGTELYLGLIHLTDGIEGAKRRATAAKRFVSDFGVATECGFGRRPPETIPDLIRLHRLVAQQV
jgi:hypothetical protein